MAKDAPARAAAQAPASLRLRIGADTVAAGSAAMQDAVAKVNQARRLEGLPDTLNPESIDLAKLAALVAALGAAEKVRGVPAGRALYVDPAALRVGAASPTTPASFAKASLEVTDGSGNPVQARAAVPVDCGLARSRAAEARRFVEAAGQEIARLEGGGVSNALSDARRRRYAAARVWRDSAAAALSCAPDDAAARADQEAAEAAVRSFIVPLGGGMPRPG